MTVDRGDAMATEVRLKNTGLRGVKVADSKISYIDGEKGVLIYRGYRIEDLADKSSFEETLYLLLNGVMPLVSVSTEHKLANMGGLKD